MLEKNCVFENTLLWIALIEQVSCVNKRAMTKSDDTITQRESLKKHLLSKKSFGILLRQSYLFCSHF